jgi:hypothetical protein
LINWFKLNCLPSEELVIFEGVAKLTPVKRPFAEILGINLNP